MTTPAERERADEKLANKWISKWLLGVFTPRQCVEGAIEAARREERKRCAELCESEAAEYDKSSRNLDAAGYTVGGGHDAAGSVASKSIAAKIRALSALEE